MILILNFSKAFRNIYIYIYSYILNVDKES
jgi:hypothetical protein